MFLVDDHASVTRVFAATHENRKAKMKPITCVTKFSRRQRRAGGNDAARQRHLIGWKRDLQLPRRANANENSAGLP